MNVFTKNVYFAQLLLTAMDFCDIFALSYITILDFDRQQELHLIGDTRVVVTHISMLLVSKISAKRKYQV